METLRSSIPRVWGNWKFRRPSSTIQKNMDSGQPPRPGHQTSHVLVRDLLHWKVTHLCTSGLLSVKWSETVSSQVDSKDESSCHAHSALYACCYYSYTSTANWRLPFTLREESHAQLQLASDMQNSGLRGSMLTLSKCKT